MAIKFLFDQEWGRRAGRNRRVVQDRVITDDCFIISLAPDLTGRDFFLVDEAAN